MSILKVGLSVLALGFLTSQAFAGSVRVYNNDSSDHQVQLKCSGSSKSIKISASTTSTYTFHSTASSCDIVGGSVNFPTGTLENGQSWKISNGNAKKN